MAMLDDSPYGDGEEFTNCVIRGTISVEYFSGVVGYF
jgi:hypothetical protein